MAHFYYFLFIFFTWLFIVCQADITKDTVQSHYESIIDDVIGEHNEDLLGKLAIIIKDPNHMQTTLRPQAELILKSKTDIHDICIAQMPGIIANQVHDLGNVLYASVETIVSKLWTTTDQELAKIIIDAIHNGYRENQIIEELGDSLDLVNLDIADEILSVFERFDILSKLKSALQFCQTAFETNTSIDSKLKEKVWSAVLFSFNQPTSTTITIYSVKNNNTRYGFLDNYLIELISDIQSELYSHVHDLARKLYEDLAIIY